LEPEGWSRKMLTLVMNPVVLVTTVSPESGSTVVVVMVPVSDGAPR
jgi:hypothetical protein